VPDADEGEPSSEEPEEPAEPSTDEPEQTGRTPSERTSSSFVLVSVAAGVFAVLAIALGILFVSEHNKKASVDSSDRTSISATAAQVAEAITAVLPSASSSQSATVQQLGTSPVVAQYNEISDAIRKVMTQLKLTSIRGTVKEVYVGNIDNSESKVIVRLDLVYVGDTTRVIPDQYLDMSLAKLDGTWKVDNVQVLNVALSSQTPTTTPSGSTAPPASPPSSSSSG
jgi:hypothetical protein